jgi:PAS domain S-box-containing protein
MSLIKKVFITVALITTAMMVALLYFGLTFMHNAVREATTTQQLQLAQSTLQNIDQVLFYNYQGIGTIATKNALEQAVQQPANKQIQQTANKELKSLTTITGEWDVMEAVTPDGKIAASLNDSVVSTSFPTTKEPYATIFKKSMKGQAAYSDAFKSLETGKPTMMFATPIHADDDRVIGVLIGQVSWATVLAPMRDGAVRETTFELFNNQALELGSNTDNNQEIFSKPASDNKPVQLAIKSGSGSSDTKSIDQGDQALVSYAVEQGFRNFAGNNWVITAEIPAEKAFAYADKLSNTLPFIFGGVVMIAIISVMLVLNRIIMRHVHTLTTTTQNIATGDLTQRVHINAHDEFGQLGQSFNRMADKLQELYRGLEAKVAQKTAQLADRVKESETARARDEAILAGMGEGLLALDESGMVALVNQRAAEIFGVPRDTLFGKPLEKCITGLRDEGDKTELTSEKRPEVIAKTTMQPITEVYMYHPKEGAKMAISVNATPILNEKLVVGIVLVVRDVTREKEVDRMKTEFISLASHQLRTPLSAIRWFSEMLVSGDAGELNAEQQEFAQNVYDSTDRMIALVGSLLNISRIESGRIMIDPKPTDVKELVSGIVNDLHAKIEERQQNLVISVHEGLPQINLDPRLISQVYMNLLTNAIKYTPKGGEVSVFVSRKGEDLVSQITDNGYGIPKAQQGKLFQKFFRAENVTKIETDGTGLGLYLVKAIIESSGGKIWFESDEGKGTTFWFSLPMSGMKAKEGEVTLDM